MAKLGLNIDHVATLRQVRGTRYPDPVAAAALAEAAGADQITVHLREDRRHIQEADVRLLKKSVQELNLEMAVTDAMAQFAINLQPQSVTLVPEKRQELTTEGGLDLVRLKKKLVTMIPELQKQGIRVSLFVDPEKNQIEMARELRADAVELHTGRYAEERDQEGIQRELVQIRELARLAKSLDLWVAAGHGLHYQNVVPLVAISEIVEFNIGHAIIARSLFVGIEQAVREMKQLLG